MRRLRPLAYALLALATPLPASALTGGEDSAPTPSLRVSASLDMCGIAAETVVCKIDASWNDIPGGERYSASVTRADGSVVDYGDVGGGGSGFWVPYAGNGTYTVSVSVYGTPPGTERGRVLARDTDGTGQGRAGDRAEGANRTGTVGSPEVDEPRAEPTPPHCEPEHDGPEPTDKEDEGETEGELSAGDHKPDATAAPDALGARAEAALDDQAVLPGSVECPDAEPEEE